MSIQIVADDTGDLQLTDFFAADVVTPCTIFGYMKQSSWANSGSPRLNMIELSSNALDDTHYFISQVQRATPDGAVSAKATAANTSSGAAGADIGTAVEAVDQWFPVMAVFASASSRTLYSLDGADLVTVVSGTNTYGRTPSAVRALTIGGGNQTGVNALLGRLAIWEGVALTAENFDTLVAGAEPSTVEAANLTAYWPAEDDWGAGDILDGSGNANDITPLGAWVYSSDNPVVAAPASDSNPVTLATPSTERSIRALTTGVDAAVTTAGSVFDTAIIAVEDNMTAIVPKQVALSVGSADIALTADGVYSYSSVDGDVDEGFDIPIKFWSPTTKQESTATITVIGVAIPDGGSADNPNDWIQQVAGRGPLSDIWEEYLVAQGIARGQLNDMQFAWLRGLGYTGSFADMYSAWRKDTLR